QWNISYQRQLGSTWMASVTYLGNRTRNTWIGTELNPAVYIPGNSTNANQETRRVLYLQNPTEGQYYSTIQESFGGTGRDDGIALALHGRLRGGGGHEHEPDAQRLRHRRGTGCRHHQQLPRSQGSEHQSRTLPGGSAVHPEQLDRLSDAWLRQRHGSRDHERMADRHGAAGAQRQPPHAGHNRQPFADRSRQSTTPGRRRSGSRGSHHREVVQHRRLRAEYARSVGGHG